MRKNNSSQRKIFKSSDISKLLEAGQRVHIVNLGCARNIVDAEKILGDLKEHGYRIADLKEADAVIVNTCAFIEDAKKESIDTILDIVGLKKKGHIKKLIVAGCLTERYGQELVSELKEVDAFTGVAALPQDRLTPHVRLTPTHYAYVKICESCYNQCSFCAIPLIKGKFISRRMEMVLDEVRQLEAQGVQEINVIGQDITAYGMDLYREPALASLLKGIIRETKTVEWIRLLYLYPDHITDELLDVIASEPRLCKYLDVPLQHISDPILKAMSRRMTAVKTIKLIEQIRRRIPQAVLRSTLIVGFPGETDADFQKLLRFIQEVKFERLGAFIYSREEGTAAYHLPHQVPLKVKRERYDALMAQQQKISLLNQERRIGQTLKVLVDEKLKNEDNVYLGRSEYDAPEVDGNVILKTRQPLKVGAFVRARVSAAQEYDLVAEVI